ncbi:hypothetical protein EKO04_001167 [Ascochyta lentis]|uniref:NAD(P)-binding domain-containing protein n=1 Tax=Ascochyta lentis TaxID=205686 RepID=A0A8H7JBW4_9PLEO|nr:hypothetical protein EKO04_001167 [Ascochyta lentis]
MDKGPTYLLTAAAGNIGKRLVAVLLSLPSRPHVVLPTSNAARLGSLLSDALDKSRIHIVEGNIKDPNFVESTLKAHNVTGVSLCLTGDDELFTTTNFLDAIKHSETVKHVVYISACEDYSIDAISNGALHGQSAAHVLVKYLAEAKLRHGILPRQETGGFSWTILGPSLFFDNDLRSKQQILENAVFDVPLGERGVSRVDPGDIALAAANALEDDGKHWASKKVMIGSLQTYTANQVARLWSDALGRDVQPTLSDERGLGKFEIAFGKVAGPAWGRDLRLMYETFGERGFKMTETDYKVQIGLLGREPSSYENFVKLTAREWSRE